jgi:ribosomal protein S18 acetylase RimI-like enzyme
MRSPEIRPFSDEHLEEAARLLAARHSRQRVELPLLPERYEQADAAQLEVESLWGREEATGWSAFRDGRLVAYIIGTARDRSVWGDHVWIDYGGHAAEAGEDVRDVYAAAAAEWVGAGRRDHFVQVPSTEGALLDSWFRLTFGLQQADGVRDVPPHTEVRIPEGFEIRPPAEEDIEALLEVDLALPRHHRASPVFSKLPLPTEDLLRDEWQKTLAGDEETVFVGYREGRPVACWSLVDAARNVPALIAPERACYLKFAATTPSARGSGIGVGLTDASLAWAAECGYRAIGTDWRVTNLLASRFWPRRGFATSFYRLYRHIP